jgi:hypothetical protein
MARLEAPDLNASPTLRRDCPDRDRLAVRLEQFKKAAGTFQQTRRYDVDDFFPALDLRRASCCGPPASARRRMGRRRS